MSVVSGGVSVSFIVLIHRPSKLIRHPLHLGVELLSKNVLLSFEWMKGKLGQTYVLVVEPKT